MPTTRATLRTSLQYKTDGRLTSSTDQDYYLNLAELEVISDWAQFDPDIFAKGRQSTTTDSDGIVLVPATFMELFRLEDANKRGYERIEVQNRWGSTGYYQAGYDTVNKKRKLQIMQNGNPLGAATTIYYYSSELVLMGALTTDEPIFPEEYRDLVALKAAQLYYEDQGVPFDNAAQIRESRYNRKLAKAKKAYKNISNTLRLAPSFDPDAGYGGRVVHV